jgi:hypothetical protein
MSVVATEQEQVVEELRRSDKLLLTTHENPDGDALGSLLSMHWILEQLGKDSVMFMSPDEFPLPWEYRDWTFEGLVGEPPEDIDDRTVVFLDCGNIDRMPVDFLQREGIHLLNIDHHHDNTRFGTVNLVAPEASCTAEIVWRLGKELGARITPPIANALYVGLVTDTGKFMYENTTSAAHRMAAELIDAGVEPHRVHRRLFEDLPFRRTTARASARSACAPPTAAWTCLRSPASWVAAAIPRRQASPRRSLTARSWRSCAKRSAASFSDRPDPLPEAGRDHLPRRRGARPPGAAARNPGRPRRHARPLRHRAAARARGPADTRSALLHRAA